MSPHLASMIASVPYPWACATVSRSTAMPSGPCRSKNAACGLTEATSGAHTATNRWQNARSPAASSRNPQPLRASADGSMPTQSGERSAASRMNLVWNGTDMLPSYNRPRIGENSHAPGAGSAPIEIGAIAVIGDRRPLRFSFEGGHRGFRFCAPQQLLPGSSPCPPAHPVAQPSRRASRTGRRAVRAGKRRRRAAENAGQTPTG